MFTQLATILISVLLTLCLLCLWGDREPEPAEPAKPADPGREVAQVHLERHYPGIWRRRCFVCGRRWASLDQFVDEFLAGEAVIQQFTGRVFCSTDKRPCWVEYLEREGIRR